MAAKGYSTATLVAQELGVDLTGPQLDQCADLISEAEGWIDQETGRSWLATSPTTSELHTISGPFVYLTNRPVSAITTVQVRPFGVGATWNTLVAGTDFELLDAANGILSILPAYDALVTLPGSGGMSGWLSRTTYTSTTPVPLHIQRATTLLVAHWMLPRLNPDRQGVESYSVGGELQVKVRADDIPPEVLRIVHGAEKMLLA